MSAIRPRPMIILAILAGAVLAFMLLAASPVSSPLPAPVSIANAGDKDCSDFNTQKRAQRFFKKHQPKKDPHGLDADNDGIACESNPCPCNTKPAFSASRVGLIATVARTP
jgi:excalibur calcium-binding domain-containing protein